MKKVIVECYGTKKEYELDNAIHEFRVATQVCEGHEKQRYATILCQLLNIKSGAQEEAFASDECCW